MPPENKAAKTNGLALWIMGALLGVLLMVSGFMLRENAGRVDRLEAMTVDRGERLAGMESRLAAIERILGDVSVKLDDLRMRR